MSEECKCKICERSKRWESELDKKNLFDEMCEAVVGAEFDEGVANHERKMFTEYLEERNLLSDYLRWRKA